MSAGWLRTWPRGCVPGCWSPAWSGARRGPSWLMRRGWSCSPPTGHRWRLPPLPEEVYAVAARLRRAGLDPGGSVPRLRVRTRAGRWVSLHASWLPAGEGQPDQVAVILQPAAPVEVAPVIMRAYGLSEQERVVTGLVCQGLSTGQIAARLVVSGYTVQDHLKSVFDKTGVRSRR